jgi:hypothetical protein
MSYEYINSHPLFPIVETINGKSGAITIKSSNSIRVETNSEGHLLLESSVGAGGGNLNIEDITITDDTIAIGNGVDVSPDYFCSTVIGTNASATADTATAFGYGASASTCANALGFNALASGQFSTSIGMQAEASGIGSVALGESAHAFGANSVAIGEGAQATDDNSIVLGNDDANVVISGTLTIGGVSITGAQLTQLLAHI